MKKLLPVAFIILLILTAGVYLFIPGKIDISQTVLLPATASATFRILSDQNNWQRIWPVNYNHDSSKEKNTFYYNDYSYQLKQKYFNTLGVLIRDNQNLNINSNIIILALQKDSVALEWEGTLILSRNPLKRIKEYRKAHLLKDNISEILIRIQSFMSDKEHIYGMNISRTIVKDTMMVSTKFTSHQYPTTAETYAAIKTLREYILRQGATETNYPMLNISSIDNNNFQTMVAIPINESLKDNNNISLKRMVRGYILEAEVKGGPYTVSNAFTQLDNYVKDYNIDSPAIPFELLVTDRSKEPDTTKWITKLYYPVF